MTEQLHFHFSLSCIGEGNGNPLQCSCLDSPRDEGAWWAAVYGVAQSQTQLKQLSNSSSSMGLIGLSWWLISKRIHLQCRSYRRYGFDPWVRKILWRRKWQHSLVFLPGEFDGQRGLVGYSPWACKESHKTEQLTQSVFKNIHVQNYVTLLILCKYIFNL